MSIYVDELFEGYARDDQAKRVGARNGNLWCHLWCDPGEEAELHLFAKRIGMKRDWFQDRPRFPHYDLTPSRRRLAIGFGATPKSLMEWLREQRQEHTKK